MKLEEYYNNKSSLYEDVEEFISLDKSERNKVNIIVLNIVIKYISEYLDVGGLEIDLVKKKVKETLEKNMLEGGFDNLQMLTGKTLLMGDSFSLDCLLDVKQTASIFKDIALCDEFETKNYFSVDFGSGTGILSLASYIAGKRKGLEKGRVVLIDQSEKAVHKGDKILTPISGGYEFQSRVGNILERKTYEGLNLTELSFWISETIAASTPSFSIDSEDGELYFDSKSSEVVARMQMNGDPFPNLLSLHIQMYPGIYEMIKRGKIAMFPNFPRKQYSPNDENSTLVLKSSNDSNPKKLHNIGEEFSAYEDLGSTAKSVGRWGDMSDIKEEANEFMKAFGDLFPDSLKR